jgi:LysR family glycine cleavage system transcriptional activator
VSLAESALRGGQLVAPFELALVPRAGFRVLCPEGAQTRPNTRAFLDWLSAEIVRMDDHRAGRRLVPVEALGT